MEAIIRLWEDKEGIQQQDKDFRLPDDPDPTTYDYDWWDREGWDDGDWEPPYLLKVIPYLLTILVKPENALLNVLHNLEVIVVLPMAVSGSNS